MSKKVSIVLPTYNGEQYLHQSIQSCLQQSYQNLELIIVDDGSTDGTAAILEQHTDDPRVQIIRHPENAKLPAALNTGFAHSTGEYLTWTSDDNLYLPTALERMVRRLDRRPDIGFVYADYWYIDEGGEIIRRVSAGPPEHLEVGCSVACFLYRREVYRQVGGYDTELFRIEDYDYWLRVDQQFELDWLPEPLYCYRRHSASLTSEDRLIQRARMFDEIQTRYFGVDSSRVERTLTEMYIAEAFERHLVQDRRGVLRYLYRSIRRDRTHLKNRGVLSILVQALVGGTIAGALRRLGAWVAETTSRFPPGRAHKPVAE